MDEREALGLLAADLPGAGDDAAVVDGTAITTDMLHETTDFPDGTTRYTAGWRSVGASLSDVAAMGGEPTAAVAAYGAPSFDRAELSAYVEGARDVCASVGADYVGGDLDAHDEFTVATTAVGRADDPVTRSGASPGEAVCVTGEWGRSAAALRLFDAGEAGRANELFRFPPRAAAGRALSGRATAMMDSSDGLARSLHQLAESSGVGFAVERSALPVHPAVGAAADGPGDEWELAAHFGEDFELVATLPADAVADARAACPAALTEIGTVVAASEGVTADGEALPDRGYTHGDGG